MIARTKNKIAIIDMKSSKATEAISRACESSGFFYLINHDVMLCDKVREVVRGFFRNLSEEEKSRSKGDKKGYVAMNGMQNMVRKPEYHEKFSCGRVDVDLNDAYYDRDASIFFDCENVWPTNVDGFEKTYVGFYEEMEKFSLKLMRLFARALDLTDEEYFVDRSLKHVTNLCSLRYSVGRARAEMKIEDGCNEQQLVLPHTDPTDFTCIIFNDDEPKGLQVLMEENTENSTENSAWVDVERCEGGILVNIGDLFQMWTNGDFKSSRHRVIIGEKTEEDDDEDRMSIVWFHCPNYDTIVDSREVDELRKNSQGREQKYRPFKVEDRTHFKQTERTKNNLPDRQLLKQNDRCIDVEIEEEEVIHT